jgi:hypothetical protein
LRADDFRDDFLAPLLDDERELDFLAPDLLDRDFEDFLVAAICGCPFVPLKKGTGIASPAVVKKPPSDGSRLIALKC